MLNYVGLLHSIFEHAHRRGWATTNPCKLVDKPSLPDDREIRFLDAAELEALLRAVPDDRLAPTEATLYLAAAMTGLRQGELLALRWLDVDWLAGRVRVRRNYVRGEYGTPKTLRSSRSVPLADRVAAALELHSRRSGYQADDDLVFGHPDTGRPLDRSKLLKRFKAALKVAGARPVTFHGLRHTFGTRMAAAGVAMRTLQEWMGHRDFKTTLRYADYAPSAPEAEQVNRAFAEAGTTTSSSPTRQAATTKSPHTSGPRKQSDSSTAPAEPHAGEWPASRTAELREPEAREVTATRIPAPPGDRSAHRSVRGARPL